jgi:6-methylsalicylate decarboxylase
MSILETTQSRRGFLETLAYGAGCAAAGCVGGNLLAAAKAHRIDVHSHFAVPSWVAELAKTNRLTPGMRDWSLAKEIEDMDQGGVATAISSITTPGFENMGLEPSRRLARECNDFAAKMMADHKGRFGMFVSVPMPDIEGTLREIEYGMDTLKADGVALLTVYGDKWLGDASFAPVWQELNRRKAVVYTHPTGANCCRNLIKGIPDTAIEYGTDTTRVIAQMIYGGATQKYPDVKVIFSHAGGTMPYLMERFNFLTRTQYAKQLPNGFAAEAAKFYYDTAQAFSPAAMSALKKIVPVSQIVFGTDYPFRTSAEHVVGLKECGVFNAKEIAAIERENVLKLVPRWKAS